MKDNESMVTTTETVETNAETIVQETPKKEEKKEITKTTKSKK